MKARANHLLYRRHRLLAKLREKRNRELLDKLVFGEDSIRMEGNGTELDAAAAGV